MHCHWLWQDNFIWPFLIFFFSKNMFSSKTHVYRGKWSLIISPHWPLQAVGWGTSAHRPREGAGSCFLESHRTVTQWAQPGLCVWHWLCCDPGMGVSCSLLGAKRTPHGALVTTHGILLLPMASVWDFALVGGGNGIPDLINLYWSIFWAGKMPRPAASWIFFPSSRFPWWWS